MYSIPPTNLAIRILRLQPTRLFVGGVLCCCRVAVDVFYTSSQLSHSLVGSYASAELQSMYSIPPANWAIRWWGLMLLQSCSRCILHLQPTRPFVGGVLSFCIVAVDVFYTSSQLGHSLVGSYPSAELQSMCSTPPANWVILWSVLILL